MKRLFIETTLFSKQVNLLGGSDLLRAIQDELLKCPHKGNLIPGAGGIRKLRFLDNKKKLGRRGAFRILYLDLPLVNKLYLIAIYDKRTKDDISPEEKKVIRCLAKDLKRKAKYEA